jgi:hypothetical protein
MITKKYVTSKEQHVFSRRAFQPVLVNEAVRTLRKSSLVSPGQGKRYFPFSFSFFPNIGGRNCKKEVMGASESLTLPLSLFFLF